MKWVSSLKAAKATKVGGQESYGLLSQDLVIITFSKVPAPTSIFTMPVPSFFNSITNIFGSVVLKIFGVLKEILILVSMIM